MAFKNPRKVHVNGEVYHYVHGERTVGIVKEKIVAIQFPDGRKIFPTRDEIAEATKEPPMDKEKEDRDWMDDPDWEDTLPQFSCAPGKIKKYIEKLLKEKG